MRAAKGGRGSRAWGSPGHAASLPSAPGAPTAPPWGLERWASTPTQRCLGWFSCPTPTLTLTLTLTCWRRSWEAVQEGLREHGGSSPHGGPPSRVKPAEGARPDPQAATVVPATPPPRPRGSNTGAPTACESVNWEVSVTPRVLNQKVHLAGSLRASRARGIGGAPTPAEAPIQTEQVLVPGLDPRAYNPPSAVSPKSFLVCVEMSQTAIMCRTGAIFYQNVNIA